MSPLLYNEQNVYAKTDAQKDAWVCSFGNNRQSIWCVCVCLCPRACVGYHILSVGKWHKNVTFILRKKKSEIAG